MSARWARREEEARGCEGRRAAVGRCVDVFKWLIIKTDKIYLFMLLAEKCCVMCIKSVPH